MKENAAVGHYRSEVLKMLKKRIFILAASATIAAAFQFKAVSSPNAQNRLRAHIVVPSLSGANGLREVSEGVTFYDHQRFRVTVEPKQTGYLYPTAAHLSET